MGTKTYLATQEYPDREVVALVTAAATLSSPKKSIPSSAWGKMGERSEPEY